jgi:HPt (histidine-containing phosphotransfer) domain-containing protein
MSDRVVWVLPEELRQLAGQGENGLVQELLAVFRTDTAERLTKLQNALDDHNHSEVRAQAHAIKGSAGQVGAMAVAEICRSIESQALTARRGELDDLARQLHAAFAEVLRAMNA